MQQELIGEVNARKRSNDVGLGLIRGGRSKEGDGIKDTAGGTTHGGWENDDSIDGKHPISSLESSSGEGGGAGAKIEIPIGSTMRGGMDDDSKVVGCTGCTGRSSREGDSDTANNTASVMARAAHDQKLRQSRHTGPRRALTWVRAC